jgi:hypothetical protein
MMKYLSISTTLAGPAQSGYISSQPEVKLFCSPIHSLGLYIPSAMKFSSIVFTALAVASTTTAQSTNVNAYDCIKSGRKSLITEGQTIRDQLCGQVRVVELMHARAVFMLILGFE